MKISYRKLISGLTAALYLFTALPASYASPENSSVELQNGQVVPVKSASEEDTEAALDLPSQAEDLSCSVLSYRSAIRFNAGRGPRGLDSSLPQRT